MHTGPSGLAFSSKSGKASELLRLDFSNGTTRSTEAAKEADGRFWRKPATWKIETLNYTGSLHVRSTLDALNSNSRSRRFAPLSTWILKRKMNKAKEACRNLTEELRNQAQTLLKTVIKTRNRLFSLASWLSRPAVQSGIKPSGQGKNRRFHQTIFKALNNVVNTTYQVVAAERRKNRLAAEGRHREPSISISTAWTRRQKSSFEEHIRTRAEVSGLLYELSRERRVAVFDFYRTVRSRLNWPEERQRAWLINGTLPALIEELRTPRLQGRDFVDEKLYAAQHYLRNFIRLNKDTIKLPIGEAYDILVNRTMTVIQEDESPRDGSDRYTLWCEFMDYGG
ncbi:unnamed protein product [Dibothriocephalus latus]|uniref:Uncharacterized protein n=1 Tax=Dibothriocephalus latus TaxID=60516 RepID=A0A3P7L7U7_DIBLA|nr:unnamed protein product [Dibothriocephalus latus]